MRINVCNPIWLADQHLIAEYRELKMLPKSLLRSINSKKGLKLKDIPKEYTLNKGHGYFFYDKVGFIIKRFNDVLLEMENRKFTTNYKTLYLVDIPQNLFGMYEPTDEAKLINLERIRLRIAGKPNWFLYKGKKMNQELWELYYEEWYQSENLLFEKIEDIKKDPIEDNKNLKIYTGGHYG